ncbi:MAG: HD-GYP domain-containing protein [Candidatus Aminicenantales bacterium]
MKSLKLRTKDELKAEAFGGIEDFQNQEALDFPFSYGEEEISVGIKSFNAPLSFIDTECLKAMGLSLEKTLRSSLYSAEKVASARGYLKNLERSFKRTFIEENSRSWDELFEKQRFLNDNLLNIIALTDKHEDTIGHSLLVARYSLLLAKSVGIDDVDFLINLERGALLHDIGKIGIPESILRKPGHLNMAERKIVEEHPYLGYELIGEYDFLRKAAQVVLYHHERFDGKGYPYGLEGEGIPLEARIFALADTLDAITSDRPYRKGGSFDQALEEIERHSGTQFDPVLVNTLLLVPVEEMERMKGEPFGFRYSILTH